MKKLGIHHISALVSDIHQSFHFYHDILGLNLLMKTVNQDNTTKYNLFFQIQKDGQERNLQFFRSIHLNKNNIVHCGIESYGESKIIRFEDHDGMKLGISYLNNSTDNFLPNLNSKIPMEHAIIGIHSVHLRVRYPKATEKY